MWCWISCDILVLLGHRSPYINHALWQHFMFTIVTKSALIFLELSPVGGRKAYDNPVQWGKSYIFAKYMQTWWIALNSTLSPRKQVLFHLRMLRGLYSRSLRAATATRWSGRQSWEKWELAAGIIMNVRSGHLKNRKYRAVSMGNKKFKPL